MNGSENPPAFPCEGEGYGNPNHHTPGMSLRDYFAGQALATTAENYPDWQLKAWFGDRGSLRREEIRARAAYEIADAMLAARGQS